MRPVVKASGHGSASKGAWPDREPAGARANGWWRSPFARTAPQRDRVPVAGDERPLGGFSAQIRPDLLLEDARLALLALLLDLVVHPLLEVRGALDRDESPHPEMA